jgi:hypothetical protein
LIAGAFSNLSGRAYDSFTVRFFLLTTHTLNQSLSLYLSGHSQQSIRTIPSTEGELLISLVIVLCDENKERKYAVALTPIMSFDKSRLLKLPNR